MLSNKKSDRMNFFGQRHKLKSLTQSQFVEAYESVEDRELTRNRNTSKEQRQRYIYINESLTQENRKLLKEVRDKSRAKKYKHKGYTINDKACVCRTGTSAVTYITCMAGLSKII